MQSAHSQHDVCLGLYIEHCFDMYSKNMKRNITISIEISIRLQRIK